MQHRYQDITIQPDIVELPSKLLIGFSFPFDNLLIIRKWAKPPCFLIVKDLVNHFRSSVIK